MATRCILCALRDSGRPIDEVLVIALMAGQIPGVHRGLCTAHVELGAICVQILRINPSAPPAIAVDPRHKPS